MVEWYKALIMLILILFSALFYWRVLILTRSL